MQTQETLGTRFKRFVTLMGAIFAISLAVIISQRLSADALAMLLGLGAGVVIMLPCLMLLLMLWRRQEERSEERGRTSMHAAPPVIVVSPPMLPGYGNPYGNSALRDTGLAWDMTPAERKFTIVGGEG